MMNDVCYYHLNHQCFGTRYLGQNAEELANLLGYNYKEYFIAGKSKKIKDYKLYFPDTIIVDGIKMVYPASAEELFIIYQLKGPLAGEEKYKQLSVRQPDIIRPINTAISGLADICSSGLTNTNFSNKIKWLKEQSKLTNQLSGFIAYRKEKPVALIEFIREDNCMYMLPEKRRDYLFITCLNNFPQLYYDYRPSLIKQIVEFAKGNKFKGISVIAGSNTIFPNGPIKFFHDLNFQTVAYLDEVLLRDCWEDIFYLEYEI